jgi:isochorismate hydrolase
MSRLVEVPEYEVHAEVRVDPARTVLVVVDMQNDFVAEGFPAEIPLSREIVPTRFDI